MDRVILQIYLKTHKMKLTTENNSYLIYTVCEDRIDIENIKSYAKGDGSKLINELKIIACEMGLPIELYSEPQDDTISQEHLNAFYEKNGFELHPDDIDNSYYIYK
jgi:hypothetical protein